jgi:tetraprenyl-beta-curcumene synthase
MKTPSQPLPLMKSLYKAVWPKVHEELYRWRKRAESIPNEELRKQALMSIDTKTFHCEGGAVYSILAGDYMDDSIRFVIAYQTISDYLDNLCDRSTSLDPEDFRALHASMGHALTPDAPLENYYRKREDQDDGGYLASLVLTCQEVLARSPQYEKIQKSLHELCQYYCDLQVHKHVVEEERIPRLKSWFKDHKHTLPEMKWYEFSACAGSTLGIFCLVSYSFQGNLTPQVVKGIKRAYFPFVQGLHILLDYFIDQDEDRKGGDLNFCFYYTDQNELFNRLSHFASQANKQLEGLPDEKFHRLIHKGLFGIYLSDEKVRRQREVQRMAKKLILNEGFVSLFFYLNGRAYRMYKKKKTAK